MLLFERSAPVSPPSPIITPPAQEIPEDNPEEITISQPTTSNLQPATDRVLTATDLQVRKSKFKFAVYKFMYNVKEGIKPQKFTFEELKKSTYLEKYTENEIKLFIKNSKEFYEDNEGNVFYMNKERHWVVQLNIPGSEFVIISNIY